MALSGICNALQLLGAEVGIKRLFYTKLHSINSKCIIIPVSNGGINMRRPTPIPESRIKELEDLRKKKFSESELRRFLCVWLRVAQNMSTSDIAVAVGWNVNTVRMTQKSFIDLGVPALMESCRGGRNHSHMTPEEEKEFLAQFEKQAAKGHVLIAGGIKEALEERLGRKVNKTTVYRMLYRNGWRKIMPRPSHPKRDKAAGEAFKKGASQNG
jgi:transposase